MNLSNIVFEYQPSPTAFSASDLTITPSTPPDFDFYYVFRLSQYVAKAARDDILANNFQADADELLGKMIRDFSTSPDAGFRTTFRW